MRSKLSRVRFMSPRLYLIITFLACTFAVLTVSSDALAQSADLMRGQKLITVVKGKTRTVKTDNGINEIIVGDPQIATVTPLSNKTFYVRGEKVGTTTIAMFDDAMNMIGNMDVEVTVDSSQISSAIREGVSGSKIRVRAANNGVMLSGEAFDAQSAEKARQIAEQYTGPDTVINSIKLAGSQQVQLNVRFVEINRLATKELGTRLSATFRAGSGGISFNSTPQLASLGSAGSILGTLVDGGVSVDAAIRTLENKGAARRLAEPNLIARSGETANFLAGGEFPIPVSEDDGKITVSYKKFGVGLSFTPVVMQDGVIALDIEPEVSAIDSTASYRIGDIAVPGFTVRRAKTSIDLKSGQSFMVAGLLQNENNMTTEQVPGLGKLPVLGPLFTSKSYQRKETELVIIVTPHLVKPIDPTKKVATPMDNVAAANETEYFLGNSLEVNARPTATAARAYAASPSTVRSSSYRPTSGHYLDLN